MCFFVLFVNPELNAGVMVATVEKCRKAQGKCNADRQSTYITIKLSQSWWFTSYFTKCCIVLVAKKQTIV